MKVYYNVHSSKTASGQIERKEMNIDKQAKLVHGGMIKVIPTLLGREVKTKLTTKGIEIEENDLKEFMERLKNDAKECEKVKKWIITMKNDFVKMDEAIEKKDGKLNYENSQEFFGYFFWTAPCYSIFTKQLKRKISKYLPDLEKTERNKIFLDLITMDIESYTFKIVEDLGKKDVFEKHPFLKHLKEAQVEDFPKIKIKENRNQRKKALEKIKNSLSKEHFNEIKKFSDLINELQIILEVKNYYWPKLVELLK